MKEVKTTGRREEQVWSRGPLSMGSSAHRVLGLWGRTQAIGVKWERVFTPLAMFPKAIGSLLSSPKK